LTGNIKSCGYIEQHPQGAIADQHEIIENFRWLIDELQRQETHRRSNVLGYNFNSQLGFHHPFSWSLEDSVQEPNKEHRAMQNAGEHRDR
jgi:hypothetical protein